VTNLETRLEQLRAERKPLADLFDKNPQQLRLAIRIKSIDDGIAECTHAARSSTDRKVDVKNRINLPSFDKLGSREHRIHGSVRSEEGKPVVSRGAKSEDRANGTERKVMEGSCSILPTESRWRMAGSIVVQYVGFEVKGLVREYAFVVLDDGDRLQYTLTIANEAFVARRARYQDAPEICSLKLHRELDAHANHPPTKSFSLTDAELATYQDARKPKGTPSFHKRRDD